jgi:FtsP/CotA-like multicopper oxidase with cupredoxin domain
MWWRVNVEQRSLKMLVVFFVLFLFSACLAPATTSQTSNSDSSESGEVSQVPLVCSTPNDLAVVANVTITAQDADIEASPGVSFKAWTYNGDVPGPVLRMSMGETLKVKLVNNSPRPASLHFHGVAYSIDDDGSSTNSIVNPGCAHIYTITAVATGVWPFHSHIDPRKEIAQGLYGAVIVPPPGEVPADHEYVVFLGQLGMEAEGEEEEEAEEAEGGEGGEGFFMTINGRANGMAEVIELAGNQYVAKSNAMAEAKVGERVRWRVLNMSPDDLHTFHLHGHRWCEEGALIQPDGTCPNGQPATDNPDLFPAQGITFEYIEDAPGEWMYHCHIIDHVIDGMFAMYRVEN